MILITAMTALLLLAGAIAFGKEPKLEIHDGQKITPKQYEEIKTLAKKKYDGVITKIYVGKLFFPLPKQMGARVYFEDEINGTYATSRAVSIPFPLPSSGKQKELIGKKGPLGLRVTVKRVFRLKKHTLHLNVPDELSYQQVKTILQAIDRNDFKTGKRVMLKDPIDLEKISGILPILDKEKLICFIVPTSKTGGTVYSFKLEGNIVTLVNIGKIVT